MKKFFKILAVVLFVLIFMGTIGYLWKNSQPAVVTYNTLEARTDTIINTTIATGNISPRDEVLIKPQISGIISKISCQAGQMVKAGDILATIKVIPEMGQLSNAESSVKMAQISLEKAERNYNRVKALYEKGVSTLEEFEEVENAKLQAIEQLQSSKNSLEIIEKGILSSSAKVSNTQVRATVTGMVLDVPVKVGNSVIMSNTFNDGTTIASIADLNDMQFVGNIDETEIGKIKENDRAKITIGALSDVELIADIEYISPKASEESGVVVFEIKAAVNIPDSLFIRAGYSANAEIITDKREGVVTLPESSIIFKSDSTFVDVLTSDIRDEANQIFEKRTVSLGLSNGVDVEILSGIEVGDMVKGTVKSDGKKASVSVEVK
ncbi:MAG: efflux RND transporter periplasmic adaptor subunit [Rikenellaceae bacterium]